MPSSLLFATSSEGRVYTLSTSSAAWREFPYLGLEFKKICAVPNFMWAIGGDRQVYVHVHGLDVPIRVREETYENERWLPIEGFSKKLLPTDRSHYSSIDGAQERSIDKIRLPSMAWQWDGDWHLDLDWDGQSLGEDGWMYALDFPLTYAPKKSWNSYVRRRHWIRYRLYAALNSWCAVATPYKDLTHFNIPDGADREGWQYAIDFPAFCHASKRLTDCVRRRRWMKKCRLISSGPWQELSHSKILDAALQVLNVDSNRSQSYEVIPDISITAWAIASNGDVLIRHGVSTLNPKEDNWEHITSEQPLIGISISPKGQVWVVGRNGTIFYRYGISQQNPLGKYIKLGGHQIFFI